MEPLVNVTLAIFVAGIIYQSGRLSVRVEDLERWREKMEPKFDALFDALRRIEHAVRDTRNTPRG